MKTIAQLILFNFIYLIASSQTQQVISGTITNKKNKPVSGATIHLLNTNIYNLSDANGNFVIKNINAGKYILTITATGYAIVDETVEPASTSEKPSLYQLLEEVKQLDAVTVTAEKKRK